MKNLHDRLKPEVLKSLEDSRSKYEFSVDLVFKALKSNFWYRDLTVDQVNKLQIFSDVKAGDGDGTETLDWAFGDAWFYEWKGLENEMDNIDKDKMNENTL